LVTEMSEANVTLKVNEEFWDTIYRGDPVLLTISIAYPDALEAEQTNRVIEAEIEELEERHERGETDEDEFKSELERLEAQRVELPTEVIGSESEPWTDAIVFSRNTDNGRANLEWGLELAKRMPEDPALTVPSTLSLYAKYAVPLSLIEEIQEGQFRINATFAGSESNEVIVIVSHEVEDAPSEEKLSRKARSLLDMGDLAGSRGIIDAILAAAPRAIEGLILMGMLNEAMGDIDEAVSVLERAREEFFAQHPDYIEPPRYIDAKLARLTMRKVDEQEDA
jgi:hypothetical protein